MLNKEQYEYALLSIAESLSLINIGLKDNLIELYKTDKIRFYNRAKQAERAYSEILVSIGSLEREQNIKRIFGILLCAEEDVVLREKVQKLITRYYTSISKLVKKKLPDLYDTLVKEMMSKSRGSDDYDIHNAYPRICYYLIRLIHGHEELKENHPSFEVFYEYMDKSMSDFMNFGNAIYDEYINCKPMASSLLVNFKEFFQGLNSLGDIIKAFEKNPAQISKTNINYSIMANLFDLEDLSISSLLGDVELKDEDLKQIIHAIFRAIHYDKSRFKEFSDLYQVYLFSITIKCMIKAYKQDKLYFIKNNAETQFVELESLNLEIKRLLEISEKLTLENNSLKVLNREWESKSRTEIDKVNKSHKTEIKDLNNEIDQLKQELDQERAKTFEINKLREFAFSVKNDYIPKETGESIEDFIKDKKIVVIGGHQNWRNKFKEQYPDITVIDGFLEGFDIKLISQADFIFLNTGFMSHAAYYKAINTIRTFNKPFDYLGKTNADLLEQEMLEALSCQW